ncbi:hypothetical protein ACPPVO_38435 [Dactylosporangium sp. McL0621]|uniref:hypothetical protein n=1 Tax=Dactylosporangium sp. McL0621 TaxID=3415678 RepID=UPI003CE80099
MRAALTEAQFAPGDVRFGVDTFQVVYRTIDARRRPSGPLAAALAEHDASCDGLRAPARLFVDRADEQVPAASSDYCAARLRSATVVDLGSHPWEGSAHLGSNVTGATAALAWFRGLGR